MIKTTALSVAAVALLVLVVFELPVLGTYFVWSNLLQCVVAVLPGCITLNHWSYLMFSRRIQFRQAVKSLGSDARDLETLYFGRWPLATRYALPAVLTTAMIATVMDALTHPHAYAPWLFGPPGVTVDLTHWPAGGWPQQALRGAALGFIGAYIYGLLLLVERARRRDVTTGIVLWSTAMPVVGPLTGAVTACLIQAGVGDSSGSSFSRDAVYLVAGMLPREVLALIQTSVRRMFQMETGVATRTLPLTVLSSVGPDVESRLAEEGIFDVASLAYASPYALMRTTTYSARQIVDWIDEALLASTLPAHWEALEKAGVTGAIDLAWCYLLPTADRDVAITKLAGEVKIDVALLDMAARRLAEDGQVRDLRALYVDGAGETHPQLQPA